MTGLRRFLLILLLCAALPCSLYCQAVYPASTIYILPSIQTELIIPLAEDSAPGGSAEIGASVRGLFLDMLELGLSGEYRFRTVGGTAAASAGFGIGGGYGFILGTGLVISPEAGAKLMFPISPAGDIFTELELGCTASLHLYDRSKIYLTGSLRLPFSDQQPPVLSIGLGIKESKPVMIPLPETNPRLNLSTELFSPDNNGEDDELEIILTTEAPSSVESWSFEILDRNNKPVVSRGGSAPPPENFIWDGYSDAGKFVSSADDYCVEWVITDRLGRSSILREDFVVDVLIFNENGKLKINIPNIIFPPQSADFSRLTDPGDIEKNNEIIQRLAEIFKRFAAYNIHIEGHANSEHWQTTDGFTSEQEDELLPLSHTRAEKIRDGLVMLGIDENRITVEGLGAAHPVVPFEDTENNWKNRRVEFILVK